MAMSLNEVISSLWSSIKTYLGNNYLSKNGKAASATVADKATADASGNVITSTYQTKLSTAQLAAANSKITSSKVTTYDAYAAAIGTKANSSDLTSHTTNNNIHVTSSDKSNWNNKSNFSGSYTDLTNKPTIPTVNNATLTIQKNGTTVKTFSANASSNVTANITVPTKTSDLTNDNGYITNTNDCVHLTGNESIDGKKSFDSTNNIISFVKRITDYAIEDTPTRNVYQHLAFQDKNNKNIALVQYSSRTSNVRDLDLLIFDASGSQYGIKINTDKEVIPVTNNSYSLGSSSNRWDSCYATTFYGNLFYGNLFYGDLNGNATSAGKATRDASNNVITTTYATKAENSLKANDSAVVHTSGNETINGIKAFTSNVINKTTTYAVTDTPTSNKYIQYLFLDKNDTSLGFLQYASRTTGTRDLALYVNDKNRNTHGIQINSENYVLPIGNDSYCLGSTTSKWKSAYINNVFSANITLSDANFLRCTYGSYGSFWRQDGNNLYLMLTNKNDQYGHWNSFRPIQVSLSTGVCNINGNAATASALASGGIGSSVTYYFIGSTDNPITNRDSWSNYGSTSSVTAPARAIGFSYTPTVGAIYSGAYLTSVLNGSGSMTNTVLKQGGGSYIFFANQEMSASVRGTRISSSQKFLCTTANTCTCTVTCASVSYTTTGTYTVAGTSSVSGSKSSFMRVQ